VATAFQAWVAIIGGLLTAILALLRYFSERSRREKAATIGAAFSATVDGLSAPEKTKQLAAAVLLRRFFDPHSEQGAAGQPYQRETVSVIAALLINIPPGELQKLLADGLAYAQSLAGADLQHCNLSHTYWGPRPRPPVTNGALRMLSKRRLPFRLSRHPDAPAIGKCIKLDGADLSYADLSGASLRSADAVATVFRRCTATNAVFEQADLRRANFKNADLRGANFRHCNLTGAQLNGAKLQGAQFSGAELDGAQFADAQLQGARFDNALDVPENVSAKLDSNGAVPDVPELPVKPG
jgi:uncharacterized protein YjbI with pentapeptide repeats